MITSRSYYKADIRIDDIQEVAPDSEETTEGLNIDLFISKNERDVLIKCLGYALYSEFQGSLEVKEGNTLQTIKTESETKWKELLNGKKYTIDGIAVEWRGLVFKDGNLDRSLIANYVFCKYIKSDYFLNKFETKKLITKNPTFEYIDSWNSLCELVVSGNNGERSLYQFINDMNHIDPNTYLNFQPIKFNKMNRFSI